MPVLAEATKQIYCNGRHSWATGLPTVFFTLNAADIQWPGLADLLNVEETGDSAARSRAVIENPCIADSFFINV